MLPARSTNVMRLSFVASTTASNWGSQNFSSGLESRIQIRSRLLVARSAWHRRSTKLTVNSRWNRFENRSAFTEQSLVLMLHSDCGAYGGLEGGFRGNARLEAQHHEEELRRAAEHLQKTIPGIGVQAYFVDFEGVWTVELTGQFAGSTAVSGT